MKRNFARRSACVTPPAPAAPVVSRAFVAATAPRPGAATPGRIDSDSLRDENQTGSNPIQVNPSRSNRIKPQIIKKSAQPLLSFFSQSPGRQHLGRFPLAGPADAERPTFRSAPVWHRRVPRGRAVSDQRRGPCAAWRPARRLTPPAAGSRGSPRFAVSSLPPALGNESESNHGKHGLHGLRNAPEPSRFRVFRVFRGSQTKLIQAYPKQTKPCIPSTPHRPHPRSVQNGRHGEKAQFLCAAFNMINRAEPRACGHIREPIPPDSEPEAERNAGSASNAAGAAAEGHGAKRLASNRTGVNPPSGMIRGGGGNVGRI